MELVVKEFKDFLLRFGECSCVSYSKFRNKSESYMVFNVLSTANSELTAPAPENLDQCYALMSVYRFQHYKFINVYVTEEVVDSSYSYYWRIVYKI